MLLRHINQERKSLRPIISRCIMRSVLALVCLLGLQKAEAQPPIGIKLGAGRSMSAVGLRTGTYETWTPKNKTGVVVGLFTHLPLRDGWLFQPGLQYVSKGYGEHYFRNGPDFYYDFVINARLPYIEAPLNVLYATRPDGNGFLLGGGPAVGFVQGQGRRYGGIKTIDAGVNLVAAYKVPIGFSVNLTYTYGLMNGSRQGYYVQKLKNRFLALTACYLF